jgi:6-phosphogluconate dehydrogenase
MPGGQKEAYELVAPILKQIAAVAEDGEPCVTYIGADGAGHYVKWFITVLNTAICSLLQKPTLY